MWFKPEVSSRVRGTDIHTPTLTPRGYPYPCSSLCLNQCIQLKSCSSHDQLCTIKYIYHCTYQYVYIIKTSSFFDRHFTCVVASNSHLTQSITRCLDTVNMVSVLAPRWHELIPVPTWNTLQVFHTVNFHQPSKNNFVIILFWRIWKKKFKFKWMSRPDFASGSELGDPP